MTPFVSRSPGALLAMVCSAAVLMLAPATTRSVVCVGEDGHFAIEATRAGQLCIDQEMPHAAADAALAAAPCSDTPISLPTVGARDPQPAPVFALVSVEIPAPSAFSGHRPVPWPPRESAQQAAILRSVVLVI